tara:strand:+ start:635 stop:868 length:234 start_codon:yes stop_codon:yes gene_type:complete
MIEAGVTGAIAVIAACATVSNRIHNRIHEMDKRMDGVELRIAEQYVKRHELSTALEKFEDHMIRIEAKIDQLTLKKT